MTSFMLGESRCHCAHRGNDHPLPVTLTPPHRPLNTKYSPLWYITIDWGYLISAGVRGFDIRGEEITSGSLHKLPAGFLEVCLVKIVLEESAGPSFSYISPNPKPNPETTNPNSPIR